MFSQFRLYNACACACMPLRSYVCVFLPGSVQEAACGALALATGAGASAPFISSVVAQEAVDLALTALGRFSRCEILVVVADSSTPD